MAEQVDIQYKQASITPFWKKLPFFFLFPFRLGPLAFILGITVASAFASLALGGMGMVIKGTLVYLGLRFGINVLELFSQGRFEGHSMEHSLWGGSERRPAKLGLIVALFVALCILLGNVALNARIASNPAAQEQLLAQYKQEQALEKGLADAEAAAFEQRTGIDISDDDGVQGAEEDAEQDLAAAQASEAASERAEILAQYRPKVTEPLWYKLQPVWYWLVVLALSLLLPSAFIEIALEDKFFRALNPMHMFRFIGSMGSAYFAMWSLFLVIGGARQFALRSGASLPQAVRFPLEMALATYLGLVLFAMIGYTLYQYHQELDLDVSVDFDRHRKAGGAEAIAKAGSVMAAVRTSEPTDPLERKVQALLADGNVEGAITEIKDEMRYDRFNPDLNTRLHGLYVKLADPAKTLAHGQQWISALARGKDDQQVLAAMLDMQAIDPAFAIEDGDAILPATRAALLRRESAVAMKLVRSFDKRYPGHKDTAEVFFLAAKLASEHFRQHGQAVQILRMLLAKFPDAPVSTEARTYLTVLEATIAQMSAA